MRSSQRLLGITSKSDRDQSELKFGREFDLACVNGESDKKKRVIFAFLERKKKQKKKD